MPLTVCPLSNVKLRVFPDLRHHNFKAMYDAGLRVMINSDDPAYFGGYVDDNFAQLRAAGIVDDALAGELAANAVASSFLDDEGKALLFAEIRDYASSIGVPVPRRAA